MKHRLAAGCLVVDEDRVLLVRYLKRDGGDWWVAPGGGVQGDESIADAAAREVQERRSKGIVEAAWVRVLLKASSISSLGA